LPPHLAKRPRDNDDQPSRSTSPDSSDKRRRVLGPTRTPSASRPRSGSSSSEDSGGPAPPSAPKPRYGPTAPPAPLSERPPDPPSDDSDSDSTDDDFGPAPPPPGGLPSAHRHDEQNPIRSAFDTDTRYAKREDTKKVQRDEWMTLPPTHDDLAARMDPTKLRARKFNSGKGAKGGGAAGQDMGVWTETPEQKLKRLQNEALGVTAPANTATAASSHASRRTREEEEKARRIKEKIEAARGKSLMEKHKEQGTGKEKEDDPSKRKFDHEKDMGVGMKVSNKQRQEMLNKSKGFGDRFSGGSFL
ncbi:hypothetical protein BCR34DRAFT_465125, partial [Clohesyomyces aquaticus]